MACQRYVGKSKVFQQLLDETFDRLVAEKKGRTQEEVQAKVHKQFEEVEIAKKRESMTRAREAAAKALSAKRQKRSITLG